MEKLLQECEAFFKEKGFLDIQDDDYYYDAEGTFYEWNEECSVVMITSTFYESTYRGEIIKAQPKLKKAETIDEAWDLIKDWVKTDLLGWIEDQYELGVEDFREDEDFMGFIERMFKKTSKIL